MLIDWDYNMTISQVIDNLESNNYSKQQYNDLILSYHIQRQIENNNKQQTNQNNDKSQAILNQIEKSRKILNDQFDQTQSMFHQIQQQNIPQLNETMDQVTTQSKQTMNSLQDKQYSKKSDKLESNTSDISELENEFKSLQTCIEQYKKNFQVLTKKLQTHKEIFELEKKQNLTNQYKLMSIIQDILVTPQ